MVLNKMDAQQSSDSCRPNLWTICDKPTEQEEPNEDVASVKGKGEMTHSWTVHNKTCHGSCEPETLEMNGWKRINKPSTEGDLLPEVHNTTSDTAAQDEAHHGAYKADVLKLNSVTGETNGWRPVNNPSPDGKLKEKVNIGTQNHMVDHGNTKVEIDEDEDATVVEPESEDIEVEMNKSENISAVKQEREDSIDEDEIVSDVNDEREDRTFEVSSVSVDGKKRYHCNKCNESFGSMSSFCNHKRSHCGYECKICKEVVFRKSELAKHKVTTHGYKIFHCDKCNKSFMNNWEYYQHKRLQCGYQCKVCDKIFFNGGDFVKHRRTHEYKCDVCGKVLKTKDTLQQHQVTHTGERPHECHLCGKKYPYSGGLRYHIKAAHIGWMTYKFKCGTCGKGIHTIGKLKEHERIHTGEKPYSCHICGRALASARSLKLHIMTHTGDKPFKCDICSKSYGERFTFKVHMRSHTDEKPFQCTVCGRAFATKIGLHGHENLHPETRHNIKRWHCDFCEKSFINNWKLKEHRRTHTGERPFRCTVCGMSFKQKSVLVAHGRKIHGAAGAKTHKVTHTDNKSYQCEICGIELSSTNLSRHKLTHMVNKPHKCDKCGKSFNTNALLKLHEYQHRVHTDMPFKCTICDNAFCTQFDLMEHMQSHIDTSYECDQCDKMFTTLGCLNRHKKLKHIGVSSTMEVKRKHPRKNRQVQDKERRFPCTECGKRFLKGCHLRDHMMMVHSKERPYKCPNCDHASVSKGRLVEHMKRCVVPKFCKICNEVSYGKHAHELSTRKHCPTQGSANNPSSITSKEVEGSETVNKEHFIHVEENKITEVNSQEEGNGQGTDIGENNSGESSFVQSNDENRNKKNCEDSVASDDDDVNDFNHGDVNDCDVDDIKKVTESLAWQENEDDSSENPFWHDVVEVDALNYENSEKVKASSEGDDVTTLQYQEADKSQGNRFVNGESDRLSPEERATPVMSRDQSDGLNLEDRKLQIAPSDAYAVEYDVNTSTLTPWPVHCPLEKLPHIKQEKMDFEDMGLWDKNMFSCKVEIEPLKIAGIEQATCTIKTEVTSIVKEEVINETLVDEITDSTTGKFTGSKQRPPKVKRRKNRKETTIADSKQRSPKVKTRKNRKEITKKSLWESCETCGKCILARNMRVHLRIHSGEKPFICETCGRSFRRKSDLTEHTKTHNAEKRKQLPCPHCSRNFTKTSNLKAHMLIHTGEKPYQCKECGERFRAKITLDYHLGNRHPGITAQSKWQCETCGESFTLISELSTHMQTEHAVKFVDNVGSYPCTICGKAFATKWYLARHERGHMKRASVLCPVCGEMMAHQQSLKRHLRNRHGVGEKDPKRIREIVSCPTCNKLLRGKESLKNHMMITHSEARRFSCEICGNTYKWKRGLNAHKASHTCTNKVPCPCNCPECGKLFQTREAMQRHMRYHDDNYKSKKCQICGTKFATKAHLDQHMTKHSNERPFKCTLCHMAYKRKPNLEEHMRTHTGEKNPFPCAMCDKSFVRNCLLQKHMESHAKYTPPRLYR